MNFNQIDAFRLQKAIQDLQEREDRKDDKITLFGKVGPYWIVRSETGNYPEEPEEEEDEVDDDENEDEDDAEADGEETAEEDKDDELQALQDEWNEI